MTMHPKRAIYCKLAANTAMANDARFRGFSIVTMSYYVNEQNDTYSKYNENVLENILRSIDLQSKLKLDIQIVVWFEGVSTITTRQSYMVAVTTAGYIGIERAEIYLLKMFL